MNATTLTHHAKLLDWLDGQRLHSTNNVTTNIVSTTSELTKTHLMPPEKLESVGKWCTEVNRLFIKRPKKEPPILFRKCKLSEFMFPPTKSTKDVDPRKMSAINFKLVSGTGKGGDVQEAVLSGKSSIGNFPHNTASGTSKVRPALSKSKSDLHDVRDTENTALAAKMAETIEHYVEERRIVHLNIQPQWKRKLSTGWTINRPLLYPKTPPPAPPDTHLVNLQDYFPKTYSHKPSCPSDKANGSNRDEPSSLSVHNASADNATGGPSGNGVQINIQDADQVENSPDNKEPKQTYSDLENETVSDNCADNNADKATQCEPVAEGKGNEHNEQIPKDKEISPRTKFRACVTDRSKSNDILNMLTVDDCKIVMRYGPRRVIDTKDTMIVPMSGKHAQGPQAEWNKEEMVTSSVKNTNTETNTQNTPIRLSQGTEKTTLSPSQVQSRVKAYRNMYKTYSNRKSEDKVQRPSSAAVEKAFDVLLDRNLQPSEGKSKRIRPHSSPPVLPRTRPQTPSSNTDHEQNSQDSVFHPIFDLLNARLRKQMYEIVDTQWYRTKLKFQRCKSGHTRLQGRVPVQIQIHEPKLPWASGEAFEH